uniref:Uncharacterized protein n=1 Tax=Oryza barthii TaxID=65489 RepID=A0A0D3ERK7_9ORYZ
MEGSGLLLRYRLAGASSCCRLYQLSQQQVHVSLCEFLTSCAHVPIRSICVSHLIGPFPDLPLAICFSEGQPDSIVQDIENMVRLFIEKALINREWREYNLIMSKLWSAQPLYG